MSGLLARLTFCVVGGCSASSSGPVADAAPAREAAAGPDAGDATLASSDAQVEGTFALTPDCTQPPANADCSNGLCTIPAGCFAIGAPREAKSAAPYANRQAQVRLTHAFLIGRTEVTRAAWTAMSLPEPSIDWRTAGSSDPALPPSGYEQCVDPQCPILWVSFEDAATYANRRSEAEGLKPCYLLTGCVRTVGDNLRCMSVKVDAESPYACEGYRLPTEAEWEYAARAGTNTDYYSGDMGPQSSNLTDCNDDPNLERVAWYCRNSAGIRDEAGGRPHPVAQREPNGFGLYDMLGNAYEWVNDRLGPLGYGEGPFIDPVFGVDDPSDLTPSSPIFAGKTDGLVDDGFPGYRVRRGGSFDLWPIAATSAWRLGGFAAAQHMGFRIARTLPAARKRTSSRKP
jgi:formylglycine-generating enzyme